MALLNFADILTSDIRNAFIGDKESITSSNYAKLIFTKDGHIISHGVDFLADYLGGKRGLVPSTTITGTKVFTDSGWSDILPSASKAVDFTSTSQLVSAKQISDFVMQQISNGFNANDALVFKGPITSVSDLPKSGYSAGWTYRATTKFTLASGKECEAGDLVIAMTDAAAGQTAVNTSHWFVVQANINGYTEVTINGTIHKIYSETIESPFSIYAPTDKGLEGQILFSTAGIPAWGSQSSLNVGKLGGYAANELLTSVSAADGTIAVTVGGITKNGTATGNWNINAATASKVLNALSLGNGLVFASGTNYDGSAARTINLVAATTSSLGGVKIGSNISIKDGTISLTKENVTTALGYDPENAIASFGVVSTEKDGFAPKIVTINGALTGTYRVLAYNGTASSWYTLPAEAFKDTWRPITVGNNTLGNTESLKIQAGDNTSVLLSNGTLTISSSYVDTKYTAGTGLTLSSDNKFSLKVASNNSLGGIKTGYTSSGRNYAVQLDSNNAAYVNVPWTDSSWRDIQVNDTSIGDDVLNIVPSEDIYFVKDADSEDGVFNLSLGISWYNMDTGDYETA